MNPARGPMAAQGYNSTLRRRNTCIKTKSSPINEKAKTYRALFVKNGFVTTDSRQ